MDAMCDAPRARPAWLRGAGFDSALILGGIALALLSGTAIVIEPSLFYPILVVDLWVLGYHHVIATFTRLCFDKPSFEERRWMIVYLVPMVALVTVLAAWQIGIWLIVTIYFYWQWWHYTRQSWGISRAYRRADPAALYEDGWLDQAIFYSMPVYGILLRSSENHSQFIGMELWALPVAGAVASIAGYAAGALLVVWATRRFVAAVRGRPRHRPHPLHVDPPRDLRRRLHMDAGHHVRLADDQHLAQLPVHPLCLDVQQPAFQGGARSTGAPSSPTSARTDDCGSIC